MTQRFILDENVFICAQLETNVHGEPDPTCLDLLQGNPGNLPPHGLRLCPLRKNSAPVEPAGPQRRGFDSAILRTLGQAIFRPGKLEYLKKSSAFCRGD